MKSMSPDFYKQKQWSDQSAPAASNFAQTARELRLARAAGQRSHGYEVANKGAAKPKGPGPMSRVMSRLAAAGFAVAATTAIAVTTDVHTGEFTSEVISQATNLQDSFLRLK